MKNLMKNLIFLSLAFICLLFVFWFSLGFFPNPLEEITAKKSYSLKVTDRNGVLLKEFLSAEEFKRERLSLNKYSPNLIKAVLAAEDKRFYKHHGVDFLAVIRAVYLNVKHQSIYSGASTITMQLARLNKGLAPGPRTFKRKTKEVWWALLIEKHNSKNEILEQYLSLAPCGNLSQGFQAASLVYLNKSVQKLSPSEAAFLAGLPSSPGYLNPYKNPHRALKRRTLVLNLMEKNNFLSASETQRAKIEPLNINKIPNSFQAPHFVNYFYNNFVNENSVSLVKTTLNLTLQKEIENIAKKTIEAHAVQGLGQISVVVLSRKEREVLAWLGSDNFYEAQEGQNDGVLAFRQPGSAIKPFVYALAFKYNIISPAGLINDEAVDYDIKIGTFHPTNYSGKYHGVVSARVALASSLNVPTLRIAELVKVERLLALLKDFSFTSLEKDSEYYGLSLALGGAEVNLLELTNAYAALADKGQYKDIKINLKAENKKLRSVLNEDVVYLISNILSDKEARITGFGENSVLNTPYFTAVKTGTSKNFRDNWAVGYNNDFIVGVWAGNFDGSPMAEVSGITGAGTAWREIFDYLYKNNYFQDAQLKQPLGIEKKYVCPISGLLYGPNCLNKKLEVFLEGKVETCRHESLKNGYLNSKVKVIGLNRKFKILRPINNELYAYDVTIDESVQAIKAVGQSTPKVDEVAWFLNGEELKREKNLKNYSQSICFLPLQSGPLKIEFQGFKNGKKVEGDQININVR